MNFSSTDADIEAIDSGQPGPKTTGVKIADNRMNERNMNKVEDESHSSSERDDEANISTTQNAFRAVQQCRKFCGACVNNERVQLGVIVFIAINALMMGIATFNVVSESIAVSHAFDIVDTVFLSIFTLELGMQLIYHGLHLFLDGWLVFDFIIIIMSWPLASIQIFRVFRIVRALRLVTRIKVMKTLVEALFGVMPRMAAIGLLLLLIFYIFAVMFTQLFATLYADGETTDNYFGRLDLSFFTLFQIMTLDDFSTVSRELMTARSWSWFPLLAFVIISSFVVVNLIIAVLCEAIAKLNGDEKVMTVGESHYPEDQVKYDEGLAQTNVRDELILLEQRVYRLSIVQQRTLKALELLTNHMNTMETIK